MSLRLQGKTYSTLSDKIYLGNKQIKNIFLGLKSIYPKFTKSWTRASLPNNNYFYGLAAGSSRMITTQGNTCYWTENGLDWTPVTLPVSVNTYCMISNGNQTFCIFSGSSVLISTDNAETWTLISVPTRTRNYVAYGGGTFVVISNGGEKYMYSTDGFNWIEAIFPENPSFWGGIVWSVDRFVLGMYASGTYNYESFDGINWTKVTKNNFGSYRLIADGLGTLFMTPNAFSNKIDYSANNGVSWQIKNWWPFDYLYYWKTGAYCNGYYVFNSDYSDSYPDRPAISAVSQNLSDWYYINHPVSSYSTYRMIAFKNKIYTITQTQTRYYYYLDLN
jgi:hypothetical protein